MLDRRKFLLGAATLPMVATMAAGRAVAAPNDAIGSGFTLDETMRSELLQDAKAAWSYFERAGGAHLGMAAPNIWPEGNRFGSYDIVTMWDTGSIVLATISAHALKLIDDKTFDRRIGGIKSFLQKATYRHGANRLPNFRTRVDSGVPVEGGYDATDTGRLYVALHVLKAYSGGEHDLMKTASDWKVAATVIGGRLHDIKNGGVGPAQSNIYRYYVSRGYGFSGVAHDPVYKGADPTSSPEARAAFIAELAAIGPISTEPSLLEQVEVGASPFSQVIAEELGRAQERRHAETGRLTCVSEGPIEVEPWFTYQGYDLARATGEWAWTVYPSVTDKRWATNEFAERFRMVNTKAAFLWFAAAPSGYTQALWTHVRQKARARQFGFHPGVYEASGRAPTNIDGNTNAVILQAVAYALGGQKPLAQLQAGA